MDGAFFKSWVDAIIFGVLGTFVTLVFVGLIARVNLKNFNLPK